MQSWTALSRELSKKKDKQIGQHGEQKAQGHKPDGAHRMAPKGGVSLALELGESPGIGTRSDSKGATAKPMAYTGRKYSGQNIKCWTSGPWIQLRPSPMPKENMMTIVTAMINIHRVSKASEDWHGPGVGFGVNC